MLTCSHTPHGSPGAVSVRPAARRPAGRGPPSSPHRSRGVRRRPRSARHRRAGRGGPLRQGPAASDAALAVWNRRGRGGCGAARTVVAVGRAYLHVVVLHRPQRCPARPDAGKKGEISTGQGRGGLQHRTVHSNLHVHSTTTHTHMRALISSLGPLPPARLRGRAHGRRPRLRPLCRLGRDGGPDAPPPNDTAGMAGLPGRVELRVRGNIRMAAVTWPLSWFDGGAVAMGSGPMDGRMDGWMDGWKDALL
jgi:hypothetical protein